MNFGSTIVSFTTTSTDMATLAERLSDDLKRAMKAQDKVQLETVRAIRAALLLAKSEPGAQGEVSEAEEIKLLQRLKKQRVESATIYRAQNRVDLAETEEAQLKCIEAYLPKQMDNAALEAAVKALLLQMDAKGPADMGKVIGAARLALGGQVDGKDLADTVKRLLSQ